MFSHNGILISDRFLRVNLRRGGIEDPLPGTLNSRLVFIVRLLDGDERHFVQWHGFQGIR